MCSISLLPVCNRIDSQQSNQMKILGRLFTNNMDNMPNINHIIQKVNFCMNILNRITRYTNLKTKLILYNRCVINVFNYCIENLSSTKLHHHRKLNVLFNKYGHKILGLQSYKWTTTSIHNKTWLIVNIKDYNK